MLNKPEKLALKFSTQQYILSNAIYCYLLTIFPISYLTNIVEDQSYFFYMFNNICKVIYYYFFDSNYLVITTVYNSYFVDYVLLSIPNVPQYRQPLVMKKFSLYISIYSSVLITTNIICYQFCRTFSQQWVRITLTQLGTQRAIFFCNELYRRWVQSQHRSKKKQQGHLHLHGYHSTLSCCERSYKLVSFKRLRKNIFKDNIVTMLEFQQKMWLTEVEQAEASNWGDRGRGVTDGLIS